MRKGVLTGLAILLIVGAGIGSYLLLWPRAASLWAAAEPNYISVASPAAASTVWIGLTAVSGWVIATLLAVLQLRFFLRWRLTFENRNYLMLPSSEAHTLHQGLERVAAIVKDTGSSSVQQSSSFATALTEVQQVVSDTRDEFKILRDDLAVKSEEIRTLRSGQEYLCRRPVLLRLVRALDIIVGDDKEGRDPKQTLEGVRIELDECLEDCGVVAVSPERGKPVSEARNVDSRMMVHLSTEDPTQYGLVASVESPAYVYRSTNGNEALLTPSRISVYVESRKEPMEAI